MSYFKLFLTIPKKHIDEYSKKYKKIKYDEYVGLHYITELCTDNDFLKPYIIKEAIIQIPKLPATMENVLSFKSNKSPYLNKVCERIVKSNHIVTTDTCEICGAKVRANVYEELNISLTYDKDYNIVKGYNLVCSHCELDLTMYNYENIAIKLDKENNIEYIKDLMHTNYYEYHRIGYPVDTSVFKSRKLSDNIQIMYSKTHVDMSGINLNVKKKPISPILNNAKENMNVVTANNSGNNNGEGNSNSNTVAKNDNDKKVSLDNNDNTDNDNKPYQLTSSKTNPIRIYTDGSDSKAGLGYGAWCKHDNIEYKVSVFGNDNGLIGLLKEKFPDDKFSNPTMELCALWEVICRFIGKSNQVIEIYTDFIGCLTYGDLFDYSVKSDDIAGMYYRNNIQKPYIKYIVDNISKISKKLKQQNVTYTIHKVKGHSKNYGNDMADKMATCRDNIDEFF
jgi:ribonuclease HI